MEKKKDFKLKENSTKREDIKKESEDIINSVKNAKIKEGVIEKTPQIIIRDVDYAGKKLKISKSFFKNGKQSTLKAGIKWEDINPYFRKHINFSKKDFIK